MHQNEWFQVWFFKNFLGRGSPSPLPRPLSRFFSGFALDSSFALNSRALRALNSGFALETRALRALDSGFALYFRLGTFWFGPPQKKKKIPGSAPDLKSLEIISSLLMYLDPEILHSTFLLYAVYAKRRRRRGVDTRAYLSGRGHICLSTSKRTMT